MQRSLPIVVIAVLNFLAAAGGFLVGVLALIASLAALSDPNYLSQLITEIQDTGQRALSAVEINALFSVAGWFFLFVSIVLLALAVLSLIAGIGLLKGKNWARIIEGVLAILGILFALLNLLAGDILFFLLFLIVCGAIAWYMFFDKKTLSYFK